jgi:hypothetical protein
MASLLVVIVSKINAIQGARSVGIRWIGLIVGLDVSSKSILTMLVVFKISLMQNHTRTVILRDSILGREEIQLLGGIIDSFKELNFVVIFGLVVLHCGLPLVVTLYCVVIGHRRLLVVTLNFIVLGNCRLLDIEWPIDI